MSSLDTDPAAEAKLIEIMRNMPPGEKLKRTFELSAAVWTMARAAYDRLYPEETEDQRDERFFASIWRDAELARKFIAYRQKVLGPRSGTLNGKNAV